MGQLPLASTHNTHILRFHEVHGHVREVPLHCQHVRFPWHSILLSGDVSCRSPAVLAYRLLLVPVSSMYVSVAPSAGLRV